MRLRLVIAPWSKRTAKPSWRQVIPPGSSAARLTESSSSVMPAAMALGCVKGYFRGAKIRSGLQWAPPLRRTRAASCEKPLNRVIFSVPGNLRARCLEHPQEMVDFLGELLESHHDPSLSDHGHGSWAMPVGDASSFFDYLSLHMAILFSSSPLVSSHWTPLTHSLVAPHLTKRHGLTATS